MGIYLRQTFWRVLSNQRSKQGIYRLLAFKQIVQNWQLKTSWVKQIANKQPLIVVAAHTLILFVLDTDCFFNKRCTTFTGTLYVLTLRATCRWERRGTTTILSSSLSCCVPYHHHHRSLMYNYQPQCRESNFVKTKATFFT